MSSSAGNRAESLHEYRITKEWVNDEMGEIEKIL